MRGGQTGDPGQTLGRSPLQKIVQIVTYQHYAGLPAAISCWFHDEFDLDDDKTTC